MMREEIEEYPDGVVVEKQFEGDKLRREIWSMNDKYHRVDGPAYRRWDGGMYLEEWFLFGQYHRDCGPARIQELSGETIHAWYQHGKLHNIFGPAIILWINNKKKRSEWYLDGKKPSMKEISARCSLQN